MEKLVFTVLKPTGKWKLEFSQCQTWQVLENCAKLIAGTVIK